MDKRRRLRIELRKKDKEWSNLIRSRDKGCVICGNTERLNAHHIIPKEVRYFRHLLENGISLCPKHHKYSFVISAHRNPMVFLLFLMTHRSNQFCSLASKWRENANKN